MFSDLSNRDPPLDDPRSVGGAGVSTARRVRGCGRVQEGRGGAGWWDGRVCGRAGRGRAQEGGDDTIGDGVELGDGGAYGGRQISVFLLVTLGPDTAQTVEGHHSDKQFLREDAMTGRHNMNENPTVRTQRRLDVFVSETYRVQSGQLLGHFSHREVHEVTFVFLPHWRLSSVLLISVLLPQRSTSVLWRRPAAICQTRQIMNDKQASKRVLYPPRFIGATSTILGPCSPQLTNTVQSSLS